MEFLKWLGGAAGNLAQNVSVGTPTASVGLPTCVLCHVFWSFRACEALLPSSQIPNDSALVAAPLSYDTDLPNIIPNRPSIHESTPSMQMIRR